LTVLRTFQGGNDGAQPIGGLIFDSQGALYGVTNKGGVVSGCTYFLGCGTIYKLSPPSSAQGNWKESILYKFTGLNGNGFPAGGLTFDKSGALYGTASDDYGTEGGTVFQLAPPAAGHSAWTMNVIHNFLPTGAGRTPNAPLVFDQSGALYGTTLYVAREGDRAGIVYKLTPPSAGHPAWLQSVLYDSRSNLGPNDIDAGVLIGVDGAIYGASVDGGVGGGDVFRITQ
jgi:hypothetical protein